MPLVPEKILKYFSHSYRPSHTESQLLASSFNLIFIFCRSIPIKKIFLKYQPLPFSYLSRDGFFAFFIYYGSIHLLSLLFLSMFMSQMQAGIMMPAWERSSKLS